MNEREQKVLKMLSKSASCLLKSAELAKASPAPAEMLGVILEAGAKSMLDAWQYLNGGDLPKWYAQLCEAAPDQADAPRVSVDTIGTDQADAIGADQEEPEE